jgi:hypothetical protein
LHLLPLPFFFFSQSLSSFFVPLRLQTSCLHYWQTATDCVGSRLCLKLALLLSV